MTTAMESTVEALHSYLRTLEAVGSVTPRAIRPCASDADIKRLETLEDVTLPGDVTQYLRHVNGYDLDKCLELDLFRPELAWGMFALSIDHIVTAYDDGAICGGDENPDYWPGGFLPILSDWGGSCVVVNCVQSSPTYGAVYDMCDGVGCNRLASSLGDFFRSCEAEFRSGLRRWESNHSIITVDGLAYLSAAAPLFGNSPYFSRPGRMCDQIVDWR